MKTATRFGTDKSDAGNALRMFVGFENRRAWEAFLFCYHPTHQVDRDRVGLETLFTVILLETLPVTADLADGVEVGWIAFASAVKS